KVESFILPSLFSHAKEHAIDLIPINLEQPLIQQGPFHCIIHKIYSDEWNNQLLEFNSKYPSIPIIDSPTAIQRLRNRISMLDFINNLKIPSSTNSGKPMPSFGIPKQIMLNQQEVDGSLKSHQMLMVFSSNGLQKVKQQQIPVIVQEFVNHGGILFKVYVAGNHVKCVQRKSLPDFVVSDHPFFQLQDGVVPFSQISNLPTEITEKQQQQQKIDHIEMPSLEFVQHLSSALRQETQLNLFNYDLIRDTSELNYDRYLIIDINYFPGYSKLPGFEEMLTDFFWDVVHHDTNTQNT
ncbi:Inositol-tetrakisphosphate 1-kinase 1, partial [Bienertia sinuspersici]